MELKVLEISYELDNEEGLNALFFQTSEGYYTISKLKEEGFRNIPTYNIGISSGEYR